MLAIVIFSNPFYNSHTWCFPWTGFNNVVFEVLATVAMKQKSWTLPVYTELYPRRRHSSDLILCSCHIQQFWTLLYYWRRRFKNIKPLSYVWEARLPSLSSSNVLHPVIIPHSFALSASNTRVSGTPCSEVWHLHSVSAALVNRHSSVDISTRLRIGSPGFDSQ
jgi:hypothetical protein